MSAVIIYTEHELDLHAIRAEINARALSQPFGILHLGRADSIHVSSASAARRMIEALAEIAISLDAHERAAHPAIEIPEPLPRVAQLPALCAEQHPDGYLCTRPRRHDGQHANSTGAVLWAQAQAGGPCSRHNAHTPHDSCPGIAPEYPGDDLEFVRDADDRGDAPDGAL